MKGCWLAARLPSASSTPTRSSYTAPRWEWAVELAKHHAKVPRVLLDVEAAAIARDSLTGEYGWSMIAPWREQLLVDQNGDVFVDYLSTMTDYEADDPYRASGSRAPPHAHRRVHAAVQRRRAAAAQV